MAFGFLEECRVTDFEEHIEVRAAAH